MTAVRVLCLFLCLIGNCFGVKKLPDNLSTLTSSPHLNSYAIELLSRIETQSQNSFSSIASAVMVLNSLSIGTQTCLNNFDLNKNPCCYFTQDNFFTESVKSILPLDRVKEGGASHELLTKALNTFDLNVTNYFGNKVDLPEFRNIIKKALQEKDFIIVNFSRVALKMEGAGGHFSPVAAYDETSDQFLILDVARYKYPPFWVKAENLWNAVNTFDTSNNQYRGIIHVVAPKSNDQENAF